MTTTINRGVKERLRNVRLFAAVVRSPASVRHAFDENQVLAWWWTRVLSLHGRAVQPSLSHSNYFECIADGFRFYGLLYRVLALVFWISGLLIWTCNLAGSFWAVSFFLAGGYLWIVTRLAFSGAAEFCRSKGERVWPLVAFLFFVTVFLACTTMAISIQAKTAGWLPDAVNIVATHGVLLFGVGSYLVELAALVADEPKAKAH